MQFKTYSTNDLDKLRQLMSMSSSNSNFEHISKLGVSTRFFPNQYTHVCWNERNRHQNWYDEFPQELFKYQYAFESNKIYSEEGFEHIHRPWKIERNKEERDGNWKNNASVLLIHKDANHFIVLLSINGNKI